MAPRGVRHRNFVRMLHTCSREPTMGAGGATSRVWGRDGAYLVIPPESSPGAFGPPRRVNPYGSPVFGWVACATGFPSPCKAGGGGRGPFGVGRASPIGRAAYARSHKGRVEVIGIFGFYWYSSSTLRSPRLKTRAHPGGGAFGEAKRRQGDCGHSLHAPNGLVLGQLDARDPQQALWVSLPGAAPTSPQTHQGPNGRFAFGMPKEGLWHCPWGWRWAL